MPERIFSSAEFGKYISSTEHYQLGRIVEVEEALLKYHPSR